MVTIKVHSSEIVLKINENCCPVKVPDDYYKV